MDHEADDVGTTWNQRCRAAHPERMSPRKAWRAIQRALPKEAIISSDIGNNCAIGNAYPSFEASRKYLAPGLFGPCGYGFPSILGAKIGNPNVPVVGFAGDGAFGISANELTACGRGDWKPVTMVVFRNFQWGAEKRKLDLGVSQPVLVGDVVGVASLTTGLSTGATGLDGQLLTASLQLVNALLGPSGQVDVDGGPHAGAKIGGAGVDVSVLLGQSVFLARLGLDGLLDSSDAAGQAGEDSLDVSALLHGDDAGLVLLVDPQQEGLGVVVEDSTALGPVALHT